LIEPTARLFGVSSYTLYRTLRERLRPGSPHRSDRGTPRKLPVADVERYCEVIAAFKIRTLNKKVGTFQRSGQSSLILYFSNIIILLSLAE